MTRWFAAFVGFLAEEAAHRILGKGDVGSMGGRGRRPARGGMAPNLSHPTRSKHSMEDHI